MRERSAASSGDWRVIFWRREGSSLMLEAAAVRDSRPVVNQDMVRDAGRRI